MTTNLSIYWNVIWYIIPMGQLKNLLWLLNIYNTLNTLAFYIKTKYILNNKLMTTCIYKIRSMLSVTGQTEDQQVSHQRCPPCVLIFEIGQPIINVKIFSRFPPNNNAMKNNGAILYRLYLHVDYYRILSKKISNLLNRRYLTLRCVLHIYPSGSPKQCIE